MGTTKDYLDYLNTEVGIAPASSQEELDCAQSLAGIFTSHGLDPQVQEFSVPSLGSLPVGAVMVLLFVGVVLIGLGGSATLVLGLVLCAAAIALLAMTYTGKDVLGKFGPRAHSQNVVALHKAEGEDVSKNRPIVILAHYDTPRVDLLSRPEISVAKKMLATAAPYCVIADAICAFVQILLFLPEPFRRTLWVVGILAALPMLAWGIALIAGRFAPYTSGAVDNKSSVAAMLGVLDRVCPNGETPRAAATPDQGEEDSHEVHDSIVTPIPTIEPPKKPTMRREVEQVVGARHGARVLRDLEILPPTCEITYIEPEVRMVPVAEGVGDRDRTASLPAQATAPISNYEDNSAPISNRDDNPGATNSMATPTSGETGRLSEPSVASSHTPSASGPADADAISDTDTTFDNDATSSLEPVDEDDEDNEPTHAMQPLSVRERVEAAEASSADGAAAVTGALTNAASAAAEFGHSMKNRVLGVAERLGLAERFAHLENGQRTDEGPTQETDHSGITTMADEDAEQAASAERAERPAPTKVDDPEWGKSTYTPHARAERPVEEGEEAGQQLMPSADEPLATVGSSTQDLEAVASEKAEPTSQLPAVPSVAPRRSGVSSVARRAALFDLPDPLSDGSDALDSPSGQDAWGQESGSQASNNPGNIAAGPAPVRIDDEHDAPRYAAPHAAAPASASAPADDIQVLDAPVDMRDEALDQPRSERRGLKGLFGKKRREQQESMSEWLGVDADYNAKDSGENIGSWDHFDDDERPNGRGAWKGGAARSVELRGEVGPDDDELRDAVLSMDDAALRAHDIWFVATGASELGHAGIRQFVEENRKSLRGAFVFNLECVGAGALTALTREGYGNPRRGDRRLTALLTSVAGDLHIGLTKMARPWADTEATPLMRRSLRAVTLVGMGTSELPAFARTADDVPENVNERQVEDVAALIAEVIRRS